jgi:hypothetical protein
MPSLRITRRSVFALGGGVAAAGLAEALSSGGSKRDPALASTASSTALRQRGRLPVIEMQKTLEAEGLVSGGVLSVSITRDDLGTVAGSRGMIFTGSFGLAGTLTF